MRKTAVVHVSYNWSPAYPLCGELHVFLCVDNQYVRQNVFNRLSIIITTVCDVQVLS